MIRTVLRALLCCVVIVCLLPLQAQTIQSSTLVSRAQVHITPENVSRVHLMGIDLTHGQYVPGKYLITDLSSWEIEHILSLGFEVEILIEDVTKHYQSQRPQRSPLACQEYEYSYPVPENFDLGSMGGYLTYSEILDALDLMQLTYPELINTRQRTGIEVTHQGRPIFWVRISDHATTDEPEPEVLYTALHHAREPMSMMQMVYYMWYLLEGYGKDPEATYLLNNTELYFIPCLNPDGYLFNQIIEPDGGGYWRKNMRDNDNDGEFDENEDGVDINRNYGYEWGADDKGSSGNPSSQIYRGPSPFSEPETRAVKEFVQQRDLFTALNYHAYGNFFIYPWGYTEELNPDLLLFENYGELFALDNGFSQGTSYETVGYPTNGCSDDWMYAEHGIYAMTPELGDEFWPASFDIIPLCQSNLKNNLALAHLPHQFAIAQEMNGAFFTDHEGTIDVRIKSYGAVFSDMALTIVSLSPELHINGNIEVVSIGTFEEESYSISYTLDPTAQGGEVFNFVILLDNGFFEVRDTVTKTLAGETIAFFEDGDDISEWNVVGTTWNSTDETAHVGTTCITDSPNGLYAPNEENILQISDPIDLKDALNAVLEFWAKWEIEEYIDYAQVQISTDGINFEPLCGQYSRLGSGFIQPLEPVYDGLQEAWIKESIDLSAYIGNEVYIRLALITDNGLNLDGIYVDDIRVFVYDAGTTGTEELNISSLRLWPNPVSDQLWIATERSSSANAQWISITNALGVEMSRLPLHHLSETLRVNISTWSSGLYLINAFEDGYVISTHKIVVE
ncbi:MAG TPA: M14 family zinc carboxypeptidase [Saprospiraceae bacterium]|nr:M14 family zinc carboxypeptidase [Saprospiraceae bacterium]